MKTLWTPWRIEHVRGEAPAAEGCLFEPPGNSSHDETYLLLYRDNNVLVLLNRYPYAHGHLLIAPTRHVGCITDLQPDEIQAVMEMLQTCASILKKHLSPHGLNIGCNIGQSAGAGIADHLHFHIVPRWNGDHNFMTVLADLRSIPEHISATFNRFLPEFINLISKIPTKHNVPTG
jgi:ATP adenylyltransferase